MEACTRYHGRLLADVSFHPVVAAVHFAFMGHRPLCLSPDMIWLMIIQGVANHINAHAEALRSRIVSHQGKLTIQVRRDDFVKGSPENPWSEVFNDFSTQIRDYVGANIEQFVPTFSTTSLVERAAAEVVLLDAMQSYFEYVVRTRWHPHDRPGGEIRRLEGVSRASAGVRGVWTRIVAWGLGTNP